MEELVFLYQPCTGTAETYEMETFANNGVFLIQDYHVAYIILCGTSRKTETTVFKRKTETPVFKKS